MMNPWYEDAVSQKNTHNRMFGKDSRLVVGSNLGIPIPDIDTRIVLR